MYMVASCNVEVSGACCNVRCKGVSTIVSGANIIDVEVGQRLRLNGREIPVTESLWKKIFRESKKRR